MLENLLKFVKRENGCSALVPVYTGPGPQGLLGCYQDPIDPNIYSGFFGEVTATELISGTGLASLIGLTAGFAQFSTESWLKFLLDGKVLFVAKKAYRNSVSWNHINARTAISGSRILTIRSDQFAIRLLKGTNPDTSVPFSLGNDTLYTHNSEWNRLFYPTVTESVNYPHTSQIGPDWSNYTEANVVGGISGGYHCWCQEANTLAVYRGNSTSVTYVSRDGVSYAGSNMSWRPCLELVA